MPRSASVDELLALAIQSERATEDLYRRLRRMFSDVVEVAQFIERYASEEAGHVVWLENLRANLTPEKLAAPAVPLIFQDALRISRVSIDEKLDAVQTLDDAYHLILDVAKGEANQVLDALINTYYEDESTRDFLQDQLHQHMQRVSEAFPHQYASQAARLKVPASR